MFKQRPASALALRLLLLTGVPVLLMLFLSNQAYAQSCTLYPSPQTRFGFNVARDGGRHIDDYTVAPLKGHWYLDYFTQATPSQPEGMVYAQMIRPPMWKQANFTTTVESVLTNNPGALWIVGNEPDRDKQDGMTAAEYAVFYHDVYAFLKARDANARVAIAGVVQPTPIRLRYLELVLTEYQNRYGTTMPIDVWTIHAFILREATDWGAWVPPGLEAYLDEGKKYELQDHDNLNIFKANIVAFRQWMAAHGYRDKPLIVTEYGILLSAAHGFTYDKVRTFMLGTFDFFLSATDATTGYPADGNRLVQSWSWFSLNYPPYDPVTEFGHNGNLLEPDTGALLALGKDFGDYITKLAKPNYVTLSFTKLQLTPSTVVITPTIASTTNTGPNPSAIVPPTLTLTATLANTGNSPACNLQVHLWVRNAQGVLTRRATQTVATLAAAQANNAQPLTFTWQLENTSYGLHEFVIEATADNSNTSLPIATTRQSYTFWVLPAPFANFNYLPMVQK